VADHRSMLGLIEHTGKEEKEPEDDEGDEEELKRLITEARALHESRVAKQKEMASTLPISEGYVDHETKTSEEETTKKKIAIAFLDDDEEEEAETRVDTSSLVWYDADFGIAGSDVRMHDKNIRSGRVANSDKAWVAVHRDILTKLIGDEDIEFRNSVMLEYKTYDFFSEHVDKPMSEGHMGTALLVQPEPGTKGGGLVDCEEGICFPEDRHYIAYIPLWVRHRVNRVTEGTRIVKKVEVYKKGSPDAWTIHRRDWMQRIRDANGGKFPAGISD